MGRLLFGALAAVLAIVALFVAGPDLQAPAEPAPAAERVPRYEVTGAQWTRLGARGEPEFRAQAATIHWYADDSAELSDLRIDALGGSASPWQLQAPAGQAPAGQRRLHLTGGVHASGERPDADTLEFTTPDLWVDLLRRELRTEAPVVLRSGPRSATARGLQADFAGENVKLLDDVQVDYVPEG